MTPTTIHLQSPFPPAECGARLEAAIDPEFSVFWWWQRATLEKPVVGYVRGASLRIRMRGAGYFRNAFRAYLQAELFPADSGTTLVGTVGMHPSARAHEKTVFFFLGLLDVLGVLWVAIGSTPSPSSRQDDDGRMFLLVWSVLVAFSIYVAVVGRRMVRSENNLLTEFVVRTLDAGSLSRTPRP